VHAGTVAAMQDGTTMQKSWSSMVLELTKECNGMAERTKSEADKQRERTKNAKEKFDECEPAPEQWGFASLRLRSICLLYLPTRHRQQFISCPSTKAVLTSRRCASAGCSRD